MEEILACCVCFGTDVKLFNMYQYRLITPFERLTGIKFTKGAGQFHHMCGYCSTLLVRCEEFKQKCMYAMEFLNNTILLEPKETHNQLLINKAEDLILPYSKTGIMNIDCLKESTKTNSSGIYMDVYTFLQRNNPNKKVENALQYNNILDIEYEKNEKNDKPDIIEIELKATESFESEEEVANNKERNMSKSEVDKKIEIISDEFKNVSGDPEVLEKIKRALENPVNNMTTVVLSLEEQKIQFERRKVSKKYKSAKYKCDICYQGFISDKTLDNHKKGHDVSLPHACDLCQRRYKMKCALVRHILYAHTMNYVCEDCETVCKSRDKAVEHQQWHLGTTYKCTICDANFRKKTTQLSHMRLIHTSRHVCRLCGENFLGQLGLKLHFSRAHKGQSFITKEDVKCECGLEFMTSEALERHRVYHIFDDICDTNLMPCVICGESFESKALRNKHVKDVHDKKKQAPIIRNIWQSAGHGLKQRFRPLVCEICGITSVSETALSIHQTTHTVGDKHKCTKCDKTFSTSETLKYHMMVHNIDRPHLCPSCPKAFKSTTALQRHCRIHTGEKPYKCQYCDKSFNQSNSRNGHVKTVHYKLHDPYSKRKWARKRQEIYKNNKEFEKVSEETDDNNEESKFVNGRIDFNRNESRRKVVNEETDEMKNEYEEIEDVKDEYEETEFLMDDDYEECEYLMDYDEETEFLTDNDEEIVLVVK